MADNAIDLIVAKEAYAQLDKLITGLNEVDAKVADTVAKANAQFKNMGSITTPSMSGDNSAQMAELNQKIKELSETTKKYETQIKALSEAKKTYSRTVTQESVDATITNKNARETFQATSSLITKYEELDLSHKKAMKSAQAIGAEFGSTSKQFLEASVSVNKLGDELKSIDATLGKNNRNVGNYKSGFNGLSNSINQLTREAPAFANSIGTGFMALSNNIPILADEITNLAKKNKDLAESGQPTKSMFDTLISGVFSWQTLLSVGVTLLTIYGEKLVDWITGMDDAKDAIDAMNKSQKKANELFGLGDDAIDHQIFMQKEKLKQAGKTQAEIDALDAKGAQKKLDLRVAERDRLAKDLELATKYREMDAKNFEGDMKNKLLMWNKNRKDQAYMSKSEIQEQNRINEENRRKELSQFGSTEKEIARIKALANDKAFEELKKQAKLADGMAQKLGASLSEITASNETKKTEYEREANKKRKDELDKAYKERIKLLEEAKLREFEANLSSLNRQKEIDKDKLESFRGEINERIQLSTNLSLTEQKIAEAIAKEKRRLAKGDKNLLVVAENDRLTQLENTKTEHISRVSKFYKDIFSNANDIFPKTIFGDKYKLTDEDKKNIDEYNKYVKKSLDELKNYIDSFGSDFASSSGFKSTFDFFLTVDEKGKTMFDKLNTEGLSSKEKFSATFNAIAESAQEMFNFISNASQQNFDAEYARLESQKEIAIGFAGDSAVAKENIDKQYDKKKKEIANRENKAKQKQAMFNIAIDTAQAIMSVWANTKNPLTATALSIAVGALGAVQIAMVASQKIPQYFDGTDNHTGGLMLVNDGKGSNYKEKVVLPNGQVILPQDRNVLMEAPKGTKVLNHEQQLFEMLQGKGVSMSVVQSQGMTADEMDIILAKHFSGIKTHNTTIDKNGFNSYIRNGNSITRMNSNRSQGIGLSV